MRIQLSLVIGLGYLAAAVTPANSNSLLVRGGTLIDGTGRAPVANASILITDGVIAKVWSGSSGAGALPPDTRIMEARGKFIIPGLIDSHVHYDWWEGELFLNHGVTSIYQMNSGAWSAAVEKGLNSGQIVGPRMYGVVGFGGGGGSRRDPLAGTNTAKTFAAANIDVPADAEKAVAAVKGNPLFFLVGEEWKPEYLKALTSVAHARGIAVMGHTYDVLMSSDAGQDGIEHMTGVGLAAIRSPAGKQAVTDMGFCTHNYAPVVEQAMSCITAGHKNSLLYQWMDPSYFDEMIRRLVKNHTYLNPTLVFEWQGVIDRTSQFEQESQKLLSDPALRYEPEDERLLALGQYHWADKRSQADRAQFLKGYKNVQEFLRKFVAAGGKVYSGTDTASANTPGLSLHQEMQLFVDAGISPMNALLSSTKWAAEWTHLDGKLGTVEAGKYGDMVILTADPLKDIHNTLAIAQVIKAGVVQSGGYHADYQVPFPQIGPTLKHLYNQPPVVSNLEPELLAQGSQMWIKVSGANFAPDSVVTFDGVPLETQFKGDGELQGKLTARQSAHAGNYRISVSTPKPGGGVAPAMGLVVDYP